MMAGRPISSSAVRAWPRFLTWCERGVSSPILVIASRNSSRSSALSIASAVAPIISTSNFSSTLIFLPFSSVRLFWLSESAQFSAVWPPMVGSRAKPPGSTLRSFSMILATISGVIGST